MKAVPRNRRQVYKMRPIIDAVVDKGSFFEVNANFGRPMIAGLARLEGRAVLLLASDPFHYGGSWTADACQKVVRWVDFAETFHLPVVYLMDCPGFMIGLEAEKAATIRHGVRAMAAVNQTTVPWCTIIVRNSFGVAGVVHQPADRFSMRYAWPSAYWGSLPLEGGIEAAYRADIDAADDPKAKLKEIEDRLNKLRSPFRSAENSGSRRSSIPARPVRCCANSRGWPSRSGRRGRRRTWRSGRKARMASREWRIAFLFATYHSPFARLLCLLVSRDARRGRRCLRLRRHR